MKIDVKIIKEKILIIKKWSFDIVLIIALSFMYYLNKPVNSPKIIKIPKGSMSEIITQLDSKEYSISFFDSLILRAMGSVQSGWIDLESTKNTKADFLYKLTKAKAAPQVTTLIPGETTHIYLDQLAKDFNLDREKLQQEFDKEAKYPEGMLVPNTYHFARGVSEKTVIKNLLDKSAKQKKEFMIKNFGSYDEEKWLHFVTIASVIQKESANVEEMPLVSSVIYNRLEKKMRLQMDGTLNYGKYSHVRVTPKMIKEDKSPYNTYKYSGIPKFPVCNVSFDALKAAISPAKTDYLFFMKTKNGNHAFSCNYSTHLTNIDRVTK